MYRSKVAILVAAFCLSACGGEGGFGSILHPEPDASGGALDTTQQTLELDAADQRGAGELPAHEEDGSIVYGVPGKVTYSLYLKGEDPALAAYIANSVKKGVQYYNENSTHIEKHITANYHVGVPTAQAGYNGKMTFGANRNTRTVLHEMAHTLGIGTRHEFWELMGDNFTWTGPAGNAMLQELNNSTEVVNGYSRNNGHLNETYGLNQDWQESDYNFRGAVRLVEAMRCDMGLNACYDFEGKDVKIVNRASGLVLDVAATTNGGNVFVNTDDGSTSQTWTLKNRKLGQLSIRNAESGNRSIDTWGSGTVNGTDLKLYDFYSGDAQHYTVEEVEPGYFSISPQIAPEQCVDAYGTTAGRNVGTWGCHGGTNQQWSFVEQ